MKDSLPPQQEKLEQLKQLLPEAFTEGKVDWEKLKLSLGDDINIVNERYVLNWAGKSNAYKVLQEPTSKTLIPEKEESVDFDKTENLFIEGDNLEALKILQKSYFSKVKMIYIDPPYNTGNDSFIYPDRFKENLEDYQKNVGDKDEEGYLIQNSIFKKNRKENGHYHSNWLNMMMPRLYLAKNLLRDDGVIFISIDDNEVHNLRLLINEIFGEDNIDTMIWRKAGIGRYGKMKNTSTYRKDHEYILVGFRNINKLNKSLEKPDWVNSYGNPDNDIRGNYKAGSISRIEEASNIDSDNYYTVYSPSGKKFARQFDVSEQDFLALCKDNRIYWGKDNDAVPAIKIFENELREVNTSSIIFKEQNEFNSSLYEDNQANTTSGTYELDNVCNHKIAEEIRPKPTKLIKKLVQIGSTKNSIILDFFAGSGTSAHAIMQLNAEDGGHRKCISIQLPELCDEKKEAFKAGYKTIANIAKERIRRAGKKIKEDNKDKENIEQLDIGFKVLKIANSNFKEWHTDISRDKLEEQLQLHVDPVSEEASIENMVYELMLKNGRDLNSHIKHHNHIYSISDQENHDKNILILLLEEVNEGIIEKVLQEKPNKVIALDKLFKNNDQLKTNTALQMQDADIKFETI